MKVFRLLVYCAAIALGLAIPGYAQVASSGTIEVIVVDSDGRIVPGATVTASANDTVSRRVQVTDENGRARLEALVPSTLYVVTVELTGFRGWRNENVLVRSGQVTTLNSQLTVGGVSETVEVRATSPVIDITSATTGGDITLDLTEALPTGRSYQSYLQLVPGVTPDNPNSAGKSRRALGDELQRHREDARRQRGRLVRQRLLLRRHQRHRPGPRHVRRQPEHGDHSGAEGPHRRHPGGVRRRARHDLQRDHQVGQQHLPRVGQLLLPERRPGLEQRAPADEEFSTKETAFTAGGPIVQTAPGSTAASATWTATTKSSRSTRSSSCARWTAPTSSRSSRARTTPTADDMVSFTFLSDPTSISGSRLTNITNAQDRAREQGGPRYSANYSRVWNNTLFDLAFNEHHSELTDTSVIREPSNTAIFRGSDPRTLQQEQLGGWGRDLPENRDSRQFRGSATYNWDRHTFKGGLEWDKHENFRDTVYIGGSIYESVATQYGSVTAADLASGTLVGPRLRLDQRERFQRPDSHHQHAPQPRGVLHRVRRQRGRHDLAGRARPPLLVQQHGGEPQRPDQLRPDLPERARAAGDRPRASASTSRTSSGSTASPSMSASGPSSGSTSPRPARTSSPSTGSSRRG